jgi:hypothetical protein
MTLVHAGLTAVASTPARKQAARTACPNAEKTNADKPRALRGSTASSARFFSVKSSFSRNDRLARLARYFGDRLCRQTDFLAPLI